MGRSTFIHPAASADAAAASSRRRTRDAADVLFRADNVRHALERAAGMDRPRWLAEELVPMLQAGREVGAVPRDWATLVLAQLTQELAIAELREARSDWSGVAEAEIRHELTGRWAAKCRQMGETELAYLIAHDPLELARIYESGRRTARELRAHYGGSGPEGEPG